MEYMIPLGGSSSLLLLGRLAEKLWSVRGVNVVGMWMFRAHTVRHCMLRVVGLFSNY